MAHLSPFVHIRRDLHQIPEKGFEEVKTQQYLLNYIAQLPQERLQVKKWKTGFLVRLAGLKPKQTIGYRADMDGLPIEEQTSYQFRSNHKGMMHACGHDVHMSIALGLLTHFVKKPINDHLLFIFQPAEEGPGGALPMLQSAEFQGWKPDMILALHIAPEHPVGTIATKEAILFANTSELFVDLYGKGGHAAFPHTANDMVVAASHLVAQLQSVVARNVNPLEAAVITIGKIEGGTRQNIIAEHARLEGTIRTLSAESMMQVKSRVEALIKGIEAGFECRSVIDYGATYCQVFNHEALTREFMDWVIDSGGMNLIECQEAMTGEDFGFFLEKIPGFMFWLGAQTPYGLHHAQIEPDERCIEQAITLLSHYITWKSDSC